IFFFFFQAEDGIRDLIVTGVQTCALPISHLQLHQKKSGRRVLPVFYSDNYISLVPGESCTVSIEAATKDLQGEEALVEVDGYNEIGRASCRERVEIWVVAESLKKKKKKRE